MAEQYDNELRGIISKNDRKETETHPDIKGQCQIEGVEYWVNGWQKERKDGSGKFYSLSFKRKDAAAPAASKPAAKQEFAADIDDDLPF